MILTIFFDQELLVNQRAEHHHSMFISKRTIDGKFALQSVKGSFNRFRL